MLCGIGAYVIRNSIFDVYLMAVVGLFGYVLQRMRIPLAPVVLGLVLGPTLEQQYRTALILSEGSHRIFLESGFAMFFFALTLLTIGWQVWSSLRRPAVPGAWGAIDMNVRVLRFAAPDGRMPPWDGA